MVKYTFYSDLHIGGPHELKDIIFEFGKNVVFLGDNFDIKNVRRKDLKKLKWLRNKIRQRVIDARGIFITGNHSLECINFEKRKKILLVHGDIFHWGMKKSEKWRCAKRQGNSNLKFNLIKFGKHFSNFYTKKITEKEIQRAIEFAKCMGVSTIVAGHYHPKKLEKLKIEGITFYIVPRGRTVLDL